MEDRIKYDDFIFGWNSGAIVGKIINWKFKEKIDSSRNWVNDKINMLMMYIVVETNEGTYNDDFFVQKGELMKIIRKELMLNLKLQHGILS